MGYDVYWADDALFVSDALVLVATTLEKKNPGCIAEVGTSAPKAKGINDKYGVERSLAAACKSAVSSSVDETPSNGYTNSPPGPTERAAHNRESRPVPDDEFSLLRQGSYWSGSLSTVVVMVSLVDACSWTRFLSVV